MENTGPKLFDRLKSGLEEGIQYSKGRANLQTTVRILPEPPPAYTAQDVKTIRTRLRMSQPHFSRLLNVSSKTVQSWEQGVRRPSQSAARLLQIIEHPDLLKSLSDIAALR